MIDLFTHKQIRCTHCEFEFSITGFGSAAMIVCPACGEENVLPPTPPPAPPQPVVEETPQELPEELPQVPLETPVLCSIEHCPLITGGETGDAIAEKMGIHLQKKRSRRRTILAWTVMLQVCVLLGVALFAAKTWLIPEEDSRTMVTNNTDTSDEPLVPDPFTPLPADTEDKVAQDFPQDMIPFVPIVEPDYAISPYETDQNVFLPFDETLMMAPHELAASLAQETASPLPPPVEPVTLELANELLVSATDTLVTDPEHSIERAVKAAQMYEQLEQPLPDSMYWILGNALASQSWGEPLLESSSAVVTMTLSPDNRYLLAHLTDKTVWLWDLQSSESERSGYCLDPGTAEYIKFVFTPDLRWIIGGQKNGMIRIWDMNLEHPAAERAIITFMERIPELQDLQISPNGQWLAAYGNSPKGIASMENHPARQSIQQVNYQRGGFESLPYPVLIWNLRQMQTGIVPAAMPVPAVPQPVQAIRFSPNLDRLAVARKDAAVRVYDLTEQGVSNDPFILRGHQLDITQIVFAPSGLWVATGSLDNTVRLWNLSSSKFAPESATLYGHMGWISALAVDSSGEYLFSASYDRTIRIWNIKRDRIGSALNEEPLVVKTSLGVPESLLITQDGSKMIARGNEGSMGIYHLPSLLEDTFKDDLRTITFRNSRLSISKCLLTTDSELLIFGYEHLSDPSNSGIRLWQLLPQPLIQ